MQHAAVATWLSDYISGQELGPNCIITDSCIAECLCWPFCLQNNGIGWPDVAYCPQLLFVPVEEEQAEPDTGKSGWC